MTPAKSPNQDPRNIQWDKSDRKRQTGCDNIVCNINTRIIKYIVHAVWSLLTSLASSFISWPCLFSRSIMSFARPISLSYYLGVDSSALKIDNVSLTEDVMKMRYPRARPSEKIESNQVRKWWTLAAPNPTPTQHLTALPDCWYPNHWTLPGHK